MFFKGSIFAPQRQTENAARFQSASNDNISNLSYCAPKRFLYSAETMKDLTISDLM